MGLTVSHKKKLTVSHKKKLTVKENYSNRKP